MLKRSQITTCALVLLALGSTGVQAKETTLGNPGTSSGTFSSHALGGPPVTCDVGGDLNARLARVVCGQQIGFLKILSSNGDAIWNKGLDSDLHARVTPRDRVAILSVLGIANPGATAQQIMSNFECLPKPQALALLGVIASQGCVNQAEILNFLCAQLENPCANDTERGLVRQAGLALAVADPISPQVVRRMAEFYVTVDNRWLEYPVVEFFHFHAAYVASLPNRAEIYDRIKQGPQLFTERIMDSLTGNSQSVASYSPPAYTQQASFVSTPPPAPAYIPPAPAYAPPAPQPAVAQVQCAPQYPAPAMDQEVDEETPPAAYQQPQRQYPAAQQYAPAYPQYQQPQYQQPQYQQPVYQQPAYQPQYQQPQYQQPQYSQPQYQPPQYQPQYQQSYQAPQYAPQYAPAPRPYYQPRPVYPVYYQQPRVQVQVQPGYPGFGPQVYYYQR